MKALVLSLLAMAAVSAHAHEGHDRLVSEWSLNNPGEQQLPPLATDQPVAFECPKSLEMTDVETKLSFASSDPDVNAPKSKFPTFVDLNKPEKCTAIAGDAGLRSCHVANRPLNGDVWALSDVTCKTRKAEPCTVPDVRWTVTAHPGQLVVRMDCRDCATAIHMGQCTYAFVRGDIRRADGPRQGSEHDHPHGGRPGEPRID